MKKLIFSSLLAMLVLGFVPEKSVAQDKLYNFVDLTNPPTYPDGMKAFYTFLGQNINYPEAAREKQIKGYVFVSFIVENTGELSNIKVIRSLGYGTDEEAVRVLGLSEKWIPGKVNGSAVRTKFSLPIKFASTKKG